MERFGELSQMRERVPGSDATAVFRRLRIVAAHFPAVAAANALTAATQAIPPLTRERNKLTRSQSTGLKEVRFTQRHEQGGNGDRALPRAGPPDHRRNARSFASRSCDSQPGTAMACRFVAFPADYMVNVVLHKYRNRSESNSSPVVIAGYRFRNEITEGEHIMSNVSIVRETIIAVVTAVITMPALWLLAAPINPDRDVSSPGLDFVLLTIVAAGLVMLLRSTWRQTECTASDRESGLEEWSWQNMGDRGTRGNC